MKLDDAIKRASHTHRTVEYTLVETPDGYVVISDAATLGRVSKAAPATLERVLRRTAARIHNRVAREREIRDALSTWRGLARG